VPDRAAQLAAQPRRVAGIAPACRAITVANFCAALAMGERREAGSLVVSQHRAWYDPGDV
jgi:hypothetical protein